LNHICEYATQHLSMLSR